MSRQIPCHSTHLHADKAPFLLQYMYHSLTGAEQNSKLKSLGAWKNIERDEKLKPFFGHKRKKNLRDYGNDYLTDGSELFMCT